VKGHAGIPGNEKAESRSTSTMASLAYLKSAFSERFNTGKESWNRDPKNHGANAIPPLPPKKSCLDRARNLIARVAAQIRTDH